MQTSYSPAGVHPAHMDDRFVSVVRVDPWVAQAHIVDQPHPARPESRERSYRLFPAANAPNPQSPRTLQRESLSRAGSLSRRRSVSLDESNRSTENNSLPRQLLSNRSNNSLRRNKNSLTDMKKMATVQELPQDSPTFPAKFEVYKPRVSEDGGHGRSASAPEDLTMNLRPQRSRMERAMVPQRQSGAGPGLGLSIPNVSPQLSLDGNFESNRKHHNRNVRLKMEKPLPLPPQQARTPNEGGSPLSNLSILPRKGPRQDSFTSQATSFFDDQDSYFPLSADEKVRELMGLSTGERERGRKPEPVNTRVPIASSPSLTISPPSSKFQVKIERSPSADWVQARTLPGKPLGPLPQSQEILMPTIYTQQPRVNPISTPQIEPAADMASLMPAALRFGGPQRSASESRAPLTIKPPTWAPTTVVSAVSPMEEQYNQALRTLADLNSQSEALYARHASLRVERQKLSSTILESLREQKPGPEYVNVLLDQHMSLATISSSMDICVAKIKSLACKSECALDAVKAQAMSNNAARKGSKTNSMRSMDSHLSAYSTKSSPAMLSPPAPSPAMTEGGIISMYGQLKRTTQPDDIVKPTPEFAPLMPAQLLPKPALPIVLPTDNEAPPRRMNVKGAKAAKILGLTAELTNDPSANPSLTLPSTSASTRKPNLTNLDADNPPSPAPDRPLPGVPAARCRSSGSSPPPDRTLPVAPTTKKRGVGSVGTSTGSSRASSPEEREAKTPLEDGPSFHDMKSPVSSHNSTHTVHVYFSEHLMRDSRLSRIGENSYAEDDLLDYYKDLQ